MLKDFTFIRRSFLLESLHYGDQYPIPRWSEGPASPVGHLSKFLGLGVVFRTKLLKLFDLGYSLRLRLPLLIATGFTLFRLLNSNNYIPRVDIEFRVVDEEDPEDDDEEEGDEEVEQNPDLDDPADN